MRDQKLVELFAVQEIFVDGFSDHIITNGVMTFAGYRVQQPCAGDDEPQRVAVIRLVMPAVNISEALDDAKEAQRSPGFRSSGGLRVARH